MSEHNRLPGCPRAKLVRNVRQHLRLYHVRPPATWITPVWQATWLWASKIESGRFVEHARSCLERELAADWPLVDPIICEPQHWLGL